MPTLADLLPLLPTSDPDVLLGAFLAWVQSTGSPSIRRRRRRCSSCWPASTSSSTTPDRLGQVAGRGRAALQGARARGRRSFYTAPIKALVEREVLRALPSSSAPEHVGMLTGDATHQPRRADHLLHGRDPGQHGAARGATPRVDYVVMDEFHYYADRERGVAWQIPLLTLPQATLPADVGDARRHARPSRRASRELTGREVAVGARAASARCRSTSSTGRRRCTRRSPTWSAPGGRPIYLVNFTQRAAAEQAQNLMSVDFSTKEEKEAHPRRARPTRASTRPTARRCSASCATASACTTRGCCRSTGCSSRSWRSRGCSRSSAAPTRSASASTSRSAPCSSRSSASSTARRPRILSVRDFQQITGRAGRKGFDDRGYVVAQAPEHVIENLRLGAEGRRPGRRSCGRSRRRRATSTGTGRPSSGWCAKPPEPLVSRFDVTHGHAAQRPAERRAASGRAATGGWCAIVAALARQRDRGRSSSWRRRAVAASGRCAGAGLVAAFERRACRGGRGGRRRRAAARLLAQPHAVALPARHAGAARPRSARPTRSTC